MTVWDKKALEYAVRYGVVEYEVVGDRMTYLVSYPAYLNEKRYTIKKTVDLVSGKEVLSEQLKRYSSKGEVNR